MRDRFCSLCLTRDLDLHRVLLEALGQLVDFWRHGRREEQRLTARRQQAADLLDVRNEAHVEHAVGFVDDEDFNTGQQDLAALKLVDQAARRRDQHVDAAHQLQFLLLERHAADQQGHLKLQVLAILFEVLGDLCGQLTRWRKDQRARHAGPRAATLKAMDHRQDESSRLARTRLCNAGYVAAKDDLRDGLRLDRRWRVIAGFFDGLQDFRTKAEGSKGRLRDFVFGISQICLFSGDWMNYARGESRPYDGYVPGAYPCPEEHMAPQ